MNGSRSIAGMPRMMQIQYPNARYRLIDRNNRKAEPMESRREASPTGAPVWWIVKKLDLGRPSSGRKYVRGNQIKVYENQQTAS
ncbi:hypothetical protein M2447_001735 [Ereboglobus sp. PH5-10]|uniref:hypothetical protein n=1 Tax=Ereboglobus sp. PH5-10 TaxID=2940629 RepID=UPI0024051B5C|nr:hypothetical protein [Ereboglobus sp. PH5-10]MDF9827636.1 hypothetical protein [Ereboglobus sp. PH5-10]